MLEIRTCLTLSGRGSLKFLNNFSNVSPPRSYPCVEVSRIEVEWIMALNRHLFEADQSMHRPTLHAISAVALLANVLTPRILIIPARDASAQFVQVDSTRIDCPQSGQRLRLSRRLFSNPPSRTEASSPAVSAKSQPQIIDSAVTHTGDTGMADAPADSSLILLLHRRRNT